RSPPFAGCGGSGSSYRFLPVWRKYGRPKSRKGQLLGESSPPRTGGVSRPPWLRRPERFWGSQGRGGGRGRVCPVKSGGHQGALTCPKRRAAPDCSQKTPCPDRPGKKIPDTVQTTSYHAALLRGPRSENVPKLDLCPYSAAADRRGSLLVG